MDDIENIPTSGQPAGVDLSGEQSRESEAGTTGITPRQAPEEHDGTLEDPANGIAVNDDDSTVETGVGPVPAGVTVIDAPASTATVERFGTVIELVENNKAIAAAVAPLAIAGLGALGNFILTGEFDVMELRIAGAGVLASLSSGIATWRVSAGKALVAIPRSPSSTQEH